MVAKLVQSAATSAVRGMGRRRRRHNQTRNGCDSIRVALQVGIAVRAAEASGPRWDLMSALSGGGNSSQCAAWNSSSNDLLAVCCQSNLGPFGSGPRSGFNLASCNALSQLLTAWKHGARVAVDAFHDRVCNNWVSVLILMQSAQLDQHAGTLDLTADVSPSPPWTLGNSP